MREFPSRDVPDIPFQMSFRSLEPTEMLEGYIRQQIARLQSHHPRLSACHVVLSANRGHLGDAGFTAHVSVTTSASELEASEASEDEYLCLRDAFASLRGRLAQLVERELPRGADENGAAAPTGAVAARPIPALHRCAPSAAVRRSSAAALAAPTGAD